MAKLMEIVVEGRPAECERVSGLMVSGRGHAGHLSEEWFSGFEVIVVPVAVIAFGGNEVSVHECDIAVEVADEILHV